MSNELDPTPEPAQPMVYQIRVNGHLSADWADWFGGATLAQEANGVTLLSGPSLDQAALFGALRKMRDLGLTIVSINPVQTQDSCWKRSNQEVQMNSNDKLPQEDMKAELSTLWIFVMFNMVFADIFTFMYPGVLQQIMAGNAEQIQITPEFLLIAAGVTEIPIAMVFLSRLLQYGVNRWVNIIGAVITILWVIGGGSLTLHYVFFASIEVVCALVIIGLAWQWRNPESQDSSAQAKPVGLGANV